MDKGTETNTMAVMQSFLRKDHSDIEDPVDSVVYGPSTSNQVSTVSEREKKLLNVLKSILLYSRSNNCVSLLGFTPATWHG